MQIKDLQAKQGKVELTAEVTEKEQPREFEKFGRSGQVCNAKIKDGSGEIKLTLWNEQVEQIRIGDTIKVSNGYVNEWQGELQLSTGKFGNLEVIQKGDAVSDAPETEDEVLEEDIVDDEVLEKP